LTPQILVTGAAGQIGSWLRQSLRQPDRHLRLLDIKTQTELEGDEAAQLIVASCTDLDAMVEACRGASAVLHLGGLSTIGYSWDQYLDVNINGTYCVLEAARRAGLTRVIYASSHHVVGFHPNTSGVSVPDYLFARPDSLYGASKAAGESLGSLYHDRYGLDVICLRIGSYRTRPSDQRTRWNWLSPGDCTRLFEAALAVPNPGFRVVWGVSANSRGIMSLDEANNIGYVPQDDAEAYVDLINSDPHADDAEGRDFIGGPFTAPSAE
jgi:uronate dehydrogenase